VTDSREPYAEELPDLFAEAISLDAEARRTFLDALRAARPALAARLEELLAADRDAGAFLERPLASPGVSATLAAGDVVEGFRVETNIASGANGSVYRAVQDYPRRTVALKVLHFALPSPGAVARFRQEVRTLARLSHPGIVPLFAAGVIDPESRALPWFAMELIDGARDFRAWARDQPIADRVRGFTEACDAVHHAHLKGVVHRDLKPGNILVGADGRPRVIDFGVATSTGSAATLATHIGSLTPEGAVVGTLAYMSPEQLDAASDIDGRADVYALGVILYETCTGRLPFDFGRTPAQAMRAIAMDAAIDPVRAAPHERALRGDLAAVILRAIERDPARRYQSAADFAADLRRWIAGEPVLARRPGFTERAWRAARRRPVLSTAVALAALGALGITVTSIVGASIAYREAMRAQRYISGLLTAMNDPSITGRGRDARMADAADAIVRGVNSAHLPTHEEADGRMIAGRIYEMLWMFRECTEQYQRALSLRQETFGVSSPEALETLAALARATALPSTTADGISDPKAAEAISAAFKALEQAIGWDDPRTLDAFNWSAPALGSAELRRTFDGVADTGASETNVVTTQAIALRALVLRSELGIDGRDEARMASLVERARANFAGGSTEGAIFVAALAHALMDARLADSSDHPAMALLAHAVLPGLDKDALPMIVAAERRRLAHVFRQLGDRATALRLLQHNLRYQVTDNSYVRQALYASGLDAARIMVETGQAPEARRQLAWIEAEKDDADPDAAARGWRARAMAMQAHAAKAGGDDAAARGLAARARAIAATVPDSVTRDSLHFADDLRIAEGTQPEQPRKNP
jgi:Protein kinase domain